MRATIDKHNFQKLAEKRIRIRKMTRPPSPPLPPAAPQRISIWDEDALCSALDEANVKLLHVQAIYRCVSFFKGIRNCE